LGSDLRLQKIVCDNTTRKLINERLQVPVKTLFLENLTLTALKLNDAEIMKYALPNMNYRSILQKIRPMRRGFVMTAKRQHFLEEVFKYDAHSVLKYLLEICINELQSSRNPDTKQIIGLLSILGEVSFSLDQSAALLESKSMRYVMSLFKKYEKQVIISLIFVASKENTCWGISEVHSIDFFRSLLIYHQKFPEYAYDLNKAMPMHIFGDKIELQTPVAVHPPKPHATLTGKSIPEKSNGGQDHLEDPRNAPITPIEFAVYCGGKQVITLLLEYGATFNKNLPYLAIAFHRWHCTREDLVNQLTELGADINVPLPLFLDRYQRDILRYYMSEPHLDKMIMLEMLMSRGAKTLPNESETLQLNDPNYTTTNSLDLLVLKALKNGHKTLQPTELTFHGPRSLIMFETSRFARSIAVNANGTYSVNGGRESMGPWSQSDGKLICTATQKSMYVSAGSHEYNRIVDIPVKIITTFVIFKLFNGEFALTEDKNSSMDEKLVNMLWHEEITSTL
jgi:hypothetical protein